MTGIDLTLETGDWLGVKRPVELEGKFTGTIEMDEDRFHGLGDVVLKLQPTVGAKMRVGDVVLEATNRKGESDKVWVESVPRQEGQ